MIAVGVPTVISVPSIIDDSLDEVADAFNETYGRRIMREFTEKQRYQIACNLLDEDMADDPEKYRRASAPHQLYDI